MKIAFDPQMTMPKLSRAPASEAAAPPGDDSQGLRQLCQDFEALFVHSLFQQMRNTIPEDGFFERDMSMDFFEEIMDMEVAREMARKGGFGLGEHLYQSLRKNQP